MIKDARLHPVDVTVRRNGAGKYDFYEYNAGEEQKRRTNETMKRVKMIQYVSTMEDNKMIKLALFLGVKPHDDMGIPLSPEGYRTELTLIADKRPQIIEKYINSPEARSIHLSIYSVHLLIIALFPSYLSLDLMRYDIYHPK